MSDMGHRDQGLRVVSEFHRTYGHPIHDEPYVEDWPLSKLRLELIAEELIELTEALDERDPVETLDALCDLQYVLDGAFLALGFGKYKEAAMNEVHRSNMSKLDVDGSVIRREDGKILKGPNFSEPNLARILK